MWANIVTAVTTGVILGIVNTHLIDWFRRCRRHFAYWGALSAEIDLCAAQADTYLRDSVRAPAYRLPTIAYDKGFPALLGDGVVSEANAKAVLVYYDHVAQMNRCLDLAHAARDKEDEYLLNVESSRARMKAEHLCAREQAYKTVRAVITERLRRRWRFV